MRKLRRAEQLSPSSRYELLVHLASGGMGSVFVASVRDEPDEPLVAVKRAHAHLLEDERFRSMFIAEAKLASRLKHRNVVDVLTIDDSDGELLIVMEYVEGGSLSELAAGSRQRGAKLPQDIVLRVLVEAALGLHQAHVLVDASGRSLGLVHRDVSPHNVLVGTDGVARLADFGVAKSFDHEGTNTQSGVLKGKVAYMAPEYIRDRVLSPQLDVFALGVVAWELLTGQRLFKGNSELDTITAIMSPTECPRVSELVEVNAAIDAAIAKALAKDTSVRWETALGFGLALDEALRASNGLPSGDEVASFVEDALQPELEARRKMLDEALLHPKVARPAPRTRVDPLDADVTIAKRASPLVAPEPPVAALPPPSVEPSAPELEIAEPTTQSDAAVPTNPRPTLPITAEESVDATTVKVKREQVRAVVASLAESEEGPRVGLDTIKMLPPERLVLSAKEARTTLRMPSNSGAQAPPVATPAHDAPTPPTESSLGLPVAVAVRASTGGGDGFYAQLGRHRALVVGAGAAIAVISIIAVLLGTGNRSGSAASEASPTSASTPRVEATQTAAPATTPTPAAAAPDRSSSPSGSSSSAPSGAPPTRGTSVTRPPASSGWRPKKNPYASSVMPKDI